MVCYKVDGATGCCLIRKGVRPINSLSPFLANSIMQDHFIGKLPWGKTIHDFDDLNNGRWKKITCFTFAAVEEVCEVPIQLVPHRGTGQAADEIHTVSRCDVTVTRAISHPDDSMMSELRPRSWVSTLERVSCNGMSFVEYRSILIFLCWGHLCRDMNTNAKAHFLPIRICCVHLDVLLNLLSSTSILAQKGSVYLFMKSSNAGTICVKTWIPIQRPISVDVSIRLASQNIGREIFIEERVT